MADILHAKNRASVLRFYGIKLYLAKILSYIVDCQLVSNTLLTVLAVNHFGMSSGEKKY